MTLEPGDRVQHAKTGKVGVLVRVRGKSAQVKWDSGQTGIGWLRDLRRITDSAQDVRGD
jgi:hypothetical protein